MLQQTQVATVIPYWQRWLAALPTVRKLARAREQTLLRLWSGLGYYSRARRLSEAARLIVRHHSGYLPNDPDILQTLPGIGRYTAGAIASIAYNQPAPIVDGNVVRVLSRLHAQSEPKEKELWIMAELLVTTAHATCRRRACANFNQAIMELGATLCTPRQPACAHCPLKRSCAGHRKGDPAAYPRPTRRSGQHHRRVIAFIAHCNGRYLVRQRPDGGINAGLWEFPNTEVTTETDPQAIATTLLPAPLQNLQPLTVVRHTITSTRFQLEAFTGQLKHICQGEGEWCTPRKLVRLPWTAAHQKLLHQVGLARKLVD